MPGVTDQPGMPDRTQITARYAERTGRDLRRLDYYVAFAHFKFAVILQGVAARAAAGAMAGQEFGGPGELDREVASLADRGLAQLT